jgi:uncharacterized membrane protein YraQ (UPF0718 family)
VVDRPQDGLQATRIGDAPTGDRERSGKRRPSFWALAAIGFAVLAAVLPPLVSESGRVKTLGITFVSIVLEALPFVMLGSLIGGLIEVFLSRERLAALVPRGRTVAVFAAAALGLLIPVCECAIIPVTRRLVRKGIPFSVAVAYLIAGPIVNPLVAASTAVAYSGTEDPTWLIVAARLLCGYAVAVFIALLTEELFPGHKALRPDWQQSADDTACTCDHDHTEGCTHADGRPRSWAGRVVHAFEHGADDFLQVSQFLIIGAFVAALSQSFIARQTFVDLADSPAITIVLMMAMAVVLNLCSEADAFVAASFRGSLPLSAQMAFLVLGPMLDLKLIAMYLSFVRKRALLVMIVLMCTLVFGMTMTLHYGAWRDL